MGPSRGGLTSKIHALVDADGRPVALRLTGGQVHDACEAEALMEAMPDGATLLGDKGYDSNAIRETAAKRNCLANIPTAPIARSASPSPHGSIDSGTSSSASSIVPSSFEAAPRATTSAPTLSRCRQTRLRAALVPSVTRRRLIPGSIGIELGPHRISL